jgi:hypothetical protein
MIFKHFDGFSWFLGNVKISWFSNFLTVFHDFWAMWKSDDFFYTFWRFFMISGNCENLTIFYTFWRFFMISGQCENLMIFKPFDGFSWLLDNVKISWFSNTDGFSWFLGNVKISLLSWFLNTLTVFHDFWAMWKSHCFHDF